MMNPDRVSIQQLQALDYWRGPIEVQALPGGITNRNYRIADGPNLYVARLCLERPWLGIDRRNEVVCQRAAASLRVAPEVVHHEQGVLISRHLDAHTFKAEEVRQPEVLQRVGTLLRHLHDSWDVLTGEILYFSAFQTVRTYAKTARELNAKLPDDLDELLDDSRSLARRMTPYQPTLCHNDLLAANILEEDGRLWLIDWEYGGIGHPLFDLAGLSGNCGLDPDDEMILLGAYLGREPTASTLRELRLLKTTSLLREALWAYIQTVASDIDFDYHQYAADNLAAYREARAQLEEVFGPRVLTNGGA